MATEGGKFIEKSYKQNDPYGKKLFKDFLIKKLKHKIISSDVENYEHDIISEKDGEIHYFDVEMKRDYPFTSMEDFPFPTVSFVLRKKKLHDKNPFHYIVICYETNHFVGCHSSIIYEDSSYIEEVNLQHKERKGFDKFCRIPKIKCYFKKL